jgi:hypothetical protein
MQATTNLYLISTLDTNRLVRYRCTKAFLSLFSITVRRNTALPLPPYSLGYFRSLLATGSIRAVLPAVARRTANITMAANTPSPPFHAQASLDTLSNEVLFLVAECLLGDAQARFDSKLSSKQTRRLSYSLHPPPPPPPPPLGHVASPFPWQVPEHGLRYAYSFCFVDFLLARRKITCTQYRVSGANSSAHPNWSLLITLPE